MEPSNLWALRTDHSLRSELHTDTSMPSVCRLRVLERNSSCVSRWREEVS